MTRKTVVAFVLFYCGWVLANHGVAAASAKAETTLRYDRIQLLEHLLRSVYPDLANQLAMFEVEATFEGNQGLTVRGIKFYPCRPATSVSAPMSGGVIPLSPEPAAPATPKPPVPPRCGEGPTSESERFLNVSLDVSAVHRKRPVAKFAASGTYIDAKLQQLRKQFAGKAYPTHDEVLQVLRSKTPKYGPDSKEEFLATLPLEKIRELTGCRLNPSTATFVAELEENSLHLPPDMQWHLSGRDSGSKTSCSAAFEPFDGHLTLLMD